MNTHLPQLDKQTVNDQTQAIITHLASLTTEELAKHYKIKPEAAGKEQERWQALAEGQALHYPAWQLYDGLMYRQMVRSDLSDAQEAYLKNKVFITTALYGVINVFEPIAPHRLDFLMGFKVNGQTLKSYWREAYDQALSEEELIISLLSSEFETVFSKPIQDKMIKLVFMENKGGQLKTHSTISKKARGKCLNALVANQVSSIDGIKALVFDGFSYQDHLSNLQELVFVKEIS